MLLKQNVRVETFGTAVIVMIAGFPFVLDFDAALILSASIRLNARLAKLSAGNYERGIYCVGVLTDAAAKFVRRSRFAKKLPERLKLHNIICGLEGQLVTITIRGTTIKMPYSSARQFAQWLRVRGKEAKFTAGELAHWSEFVRQEA